MVHPFFKWLSAASVAVFSTQTFAAGFQVWEQDAASIGNYHAGYAAEAADASTAFYNPAGLTRFKNQQLVFAGVGVTSSVKYQGLVNVMYARDYIPGFGSNSVTAQGGTFAFIPAIHYVTPLTENIGFGFSIDVPFGSKVDYGKSTLLRYISTQTSVTVIDVSPTLGIKVTDKASVGFGPDAQFMSGEFDQIGTFQDETLDSEGINTAHDTGYGYHLGGLYEFTPETRVGISYHSQVVHHLTGKSSFTGPFPRTLVDQDIQGRRTKLDMTLPPYTALSIYHKLHSKVAIMASAIYTQWSTIQAMVLQDVAGVVLDSDDVPIPSTSVVVDIPQHFRNTWNLTVGADYFATDRLTLRGGLGFDQTPVRNAYRTVQMPDNNRYVVALGAHYQTSKAIGIDVGWMHVFLSNSKISPPLQVTAAEIGQTKGTVKSGADVFGAQVTWNIA